MVRILVRGIGDMGSAVAHRLLRAAYGVVIHDDPKPTTTRRGMAFADAVFDGRAELVGAEAIRIDNLEHLPGVVAERKRTPPEVQRGLAYKRWGTRRNPRASQKRPERIPPSAPSISRAAGPPGSLSWLVSGVRVFRQHPSSRRVRESGSFVCRKSCLASPSERMTKSLKGLIEPSARTALMKTPAPGRRCPPAKP